MSGPVNPLTRATTANFGIVILAPHGKAIAGAVIQSDDPRFATLQTLLAKIATLTTPAPPTTVPHHASTHKAAGSDPIKLDELAAPSDGTTLDATALLHGLMSKADKTKLDSLHAGGTLSIAATVPGAGVGADGDGVFALDNLGIYYKSAGAWILFGHVAKAVTNHSVTFETPSAGDGTAELSTP